MITHAKCDKARINVSTAHGQAITGLNDSHTFLLAPADDWDDCDTAAGMNGAFQDQY